MTKPLKQVGVRELRQNLSVYLRRIGIGETLEVTEHGRAVAILAPLTSPLRPLERLAAQGKLIPAKHDLLSLGLPPGKTSKSASSALKSLRDDRL
jgi:antitoxin (DNA-binding transcriptional repressor) of toxin-antitoxin stability system